MTAEDAAWDGAGGDAHGASFSTRLRRYRRLAGLSQEALAERAGISVRALSGMERGEGHIPYAETVRLLADALALTPTECAHFIAAARSRPSRKSSMPAASFGDARMQPARALRLSPRLPTPLTALIGRDDELAAATTLLRQATTRLLTVTGAPGVGKTSFARQLVASVAPNIFPDGVAFIDLAPLDDPTLVLPTLAQTLEVGGPVQWTPLERLTVALNGRRALLLLDTFERLLSAAPDLLALLEACDGLTALVTSRAPLRLPGECEFPLAPLALPALPMQSSASGAGLTDDAEALARLAEAPAIALFAQRARAAQPTFALTSANIASVVALCRRLDGLPLAIELAAARVALLAPGAVLERLDPQVALLAVSETGVGAHPERQRTLGAAITWSYDLLTPAEQRALRWLAIFEGGATVEAAEAICQPTHGAGDSTLPSAVRSVAPLDALFALTRQSLAIVERRGEDGAAPARLRLLDTIRAFAWEQLEDSDERADAQRAHMRYYLAMAESAARGYRQGESDAWEPLTMELANLRAALRWSASSDDAEAAALGLRLATALGPLWYAVGLPQEGLRWLDGALARVDALEEGRAGGESRHDALPRLRSRARALYMAGWLALDQGMRQRAADSLTSSVAAFRAAYGATSGTAQRTVGQARAKMDERAADDAGGLGDALNRLGDVLWRQGHYASAEAMFEESLELRRQVGDEIAVTHSLNNLAAVAMLRGHLDTAQRLIETCLAQARRIGDEYSEIGALCQLARVAHRQAQPKRAEAALDEAFAIARLRGVDDAEAHILGLQGELARAQGDLALAEARWQASLKTAPSGPITGQYAHAQAWLALGDIAREGGRMREAMDRYLISLNSYRELTVVDGAVICMERIAALATAQGRYVEGARLYGHADATRNRLGFPLEPDEHQTRDAAQEQARAALGDERLALAWETGAATPWEHAAALAQAAAADALAISDDSANGDSANGAETIGPGESD